MDAIWMFQARFQEARAAKSPRQKPSRRDPRIRRRLSESDDRSDSRQLREMRGVVNNVMPPPDLKLVDE
jgi:hypothetical protein